MEPEEKIILPPKYYLEYFTYLLDFVEKRYKHILEEKEWRFLRKYYALSEDEQCLFIRLINRRGLYFEESKIKYEEISEIPVQIEKLFKKGFFKKPSPTIKQEKELILTKLNKQQLYPFAAELLPKSVKKGELINSFLEQKELWDKLSKSEIFNDLIEVDFQYEVTFLKFLFFGNRYMDMTEFVVRDLGHLQFYHHDDDKLVAQFDDRKDAEDKWLLTDQRELFLQFKKELTPLEIYDWFQTFLDNNKNLSKTAKPSLDRLTLSVGQHLERNKCYEQAIAIFKTTNALPSRERQVRCLHKMKLIDEAIALCEEMQATSSLADEVLFAKDFVDRILTKTRKNKKLTTAKLHEADQITISSIYRGQVEMGTIDYYLEQGKNAVFSENHLWRSIFGLVFWELIFDPDLVAFHHPFQRRPSDLHLPDFYEKRSDKIIEHLDSFDSLESILTYMGAMYDLHEGKANPFVFWLPDSWDLARIIVEKIPLETMKEILHYISKDLSEHSRGFPDLFVWDGDSYEFVEVKSPTDNLSNRQLHWLHFFEENNVNAKVLRVFFD